MRTVSPARPSRSMFSATDSSVGAWPGAVPMCICSPTPSINGRDTTSPSISTSTSSARNRVTRSSTASDLAFTSSAPKSL